ncbi:hypothetical protein BP6252_06410 [Coleophoma cylindrospora]|uniref:Nudix hydrolase domain-containing protein n=1 Tax=Coleophoma cylindrospora TaxID=1849047 RepID=A0A3D8RMV0_9HELO|nr:hypothetical protein BP6252_06410 [Coleophoma cylindrospora]
MASHSPLGDRSYGVVAIRYNPSISMTTKLTWPTRTTSQVLLIHQKTSTGPPAYPPFWCFPKGHAEASDASLEETAIRELREETGLQLSLDDLILREENFHETYVTPSRTAGKVVRYFVAVVKGEEAERELTLQEKEVAGARWCSWEEAEEMIRFEECREMFREIVKCLDQKGSLL